jgi:hypothetical protein
MGLTSAYLIAAKNLGAFLEAIRSARAPEKFALKFIEDLGFKSTNDRLFIPLLKALRFIDENGVPTQRYFDFLDENRWKAVLAEGIQEAYEDLFRLNKRAYKLSKGDIAGKFKSLTQGKKSDIVLTNMVKTFMELVKFADFEPTAQATTEGAESGTSGEAELPIGTEGEANAAQEAKIPVQPTTKVPPPRRLIDTVSYRIEIVLPPARDKAVYDAIFRSLKEHLL